VSGRISQKLRTVPEAAAGEVVLFDLDDEG
jgi:hypothetical protein